MIALIPALALSCKALERYISQPDFTVVSFQEEAAEQKGLHLEGEHIFVSDPKSIRVHGSTATIKEGGKYELSGVLDDGQIIVDVSQDEDVTLELMDVSITCTYSAPIWIKNAAKVKIKLAEETLNYLSDGAYYSFSDPNTSKPTACIFSSADLTIKGMGSLVVNASFRNGIATTDDLKITNGVLTVNAPHNAIKGKDSVTITGGILKLNAGENAIVSSGALSIETCSAVVSAERYALKAVQSIYLGETASVTASAPLLTGCPGTVEGADRIQLAEDAPPQQTFLH